MTVVLSAVEDLRPYERNARTHSREQLAKIEASIREFGYTNPVLEDAGDLVAGHGRLQAVKNLYARGETIRLPGGQELPPGTIPSIDCGGWTEEQRRAYILADNKIAADAEWDAELLALELEFLDEADGFDLGLSGFSDADLAKLLAGDGDGSEVETEWQGMPEFNQQDKKAFRSIPVHFKDQAAVDAFAKLIGQKITPKTRFIWFPEVEIERYADKRYAAGEDSA